MLPEKDESGVSDEDFDTDASEGLDPRAYIRSDILSYLKHLDLSGKVHIKAGVISMGSFADVFKALVQPGGGVKPIRACAKRLRIHVGEDIKLLFEREIYVWSKLNHPNILPLLGFAFDTQTGYPVLISKWMSNGPAFQYVRANPGCDLMDIVVGIARGLKYLHDCGVIHSNLTSSNVLITDSGDAVISDFGVARLIQASKSLGKLSTGVKGTAHYCAYELLASLDARHSKASDVWAFGVTVFELLTGRRAYEGFPYFVVLVKIQRMELPTLPESFENSVPTAVRDVLWELCQLCWVQDPSKRPSAQALLQFLEARGHK